MALKIPQKTLNDNFKLIELQSDLEELNYLAGGKPQIITLNSDHMRLQYVGGKIKTFTLVRDGQGRIIKITDQEDESFVEIKY